MTQLEQIELAAKTNLAALPSRIVVVLARRAYPSLIYFHQTDKGGHFAAWEQPQLFAQELGASFKSLR